MKFRNITRIGIKFVKRLIIYVLRFLKSNSSFLGTPKGCVRYKDWVLKNTESNVIYHSLVSESISIENDDVVTIDDHVHKLIANERERIIPEQFILEISNVRVWGKDGTIITSDDYVLEDLCREFGKYKGKHGKELLVFNRVFLGKLKKIKGTVALLAHPGADNYWHWMFDIMPRFLVLQKYNFLQKIDFYIIDYTALPFQKLCIEKLGISEDKIITPTSRWKYHVEVENLIVPSLPDTLGQTNDLALELLRTFWGISSAKQINLNKKIYISRKNALSRKLINELEIKNKLIDKGFEEYFPEDYTMDEVANYFSDASFIIGVHGAGFANIAFCPSSVKVLDFVAPYHIDPNFYILTSRIGGRYGYLFSEGERPPEDMDLVKNKFDKDLYIEIEKIEKILDVMDNL